MVGLERKGIYNNSLFLGGSSMIITPGSSPLEVDGAFSFIDRPMPDLPLLKV
jgi:hypothetical protein